MADKELLYRLNDPDMATLSPPYFKVAPAALDRVYVSAVGAEAWLTEHLGVTRFNVVSEMWGPLSVVFAGTFDAEDFLVVFEASN